MISVSKNFLNFEVINFDSFLPIVISQLFKILNKIQNAHLWHSILVRRRNQTLQVLSDTLCRQNSTIPKITKENSKILSLLILLFLQKLLLLGDQLLDDVSAEIEVFRVEKADEGTVDGAAMREVDGTAGDDIDDCGTVLVEIVLQECRQLLQVGFNWRTAVLKKLNFH